MKTIYQLIKPTYLAVAIISLLVISAFVLTNRIMNPMGTSDSVAAGCSDSLYPRCKDGSCSSGYKCGQDEKGGCKCIPVSSPSNTPTTTPTSAPSPTPTGTTLPTPTPTVELVNNTGYIPVVLTAQEQVINNEATTLFNILPASGSTFIVDFDYKSDKYLVKLFSNNSKGDFDKWTNEKKMTNIPTDYYIFNNPPPNPGDANNDSQTDGKDFLIWLNNFGKSTEGGIINGDYYTDGAIDTKDYLIWITSY